MSNRSSFKDGERVRRWRRWVVQATAGQDRDQQGHGCIFDHRRAELLYARVHVACAGGYDIVGLVNNLEGKFKNVVMTQDCIPVGNLSFASTHKKEVSPPSEMVYRAPR